MVRVQNNLLNMVVWGHNESFVAEIRLPNSSLICIKTKLRKGMKLLPFPLKSHFPSPLEISLSSKPHCLAADNHCLKLMPVSQVQVPMFLQTSNFSQSLQSPNLSTFSSHLIFHKKRYFLVVLFGCLVDWLVG